MRTFSLMVYVLMLPACSYAPTKGEALEAQACLDKLAVWCDDLDGDGYGDSMDSSHHPSGCDKLPVEGSTVRFTETIKSKTNKYEVGTLAAFVKDCTDCNDRDPAINPESKADCNAEVNGKDEDCDGKYDELSGPSCYVDDDKDGYYVLVESTVCDPDDCVASLPTGANVDIDCNDADGSIHPGASIVVCGADKDLDCDGEVDQCKVHGEGVKLSAKGATIEAVQAVTMRDILLDDDEYKDLVYIFASNMTKYTAGMFKGGANSLSGTTEILQESSGVNYYSSVLPPTISGSGTHVVASSYGSSDLFQITVKDQLLSSTGYTSGLSSVGSIVVAQLVEPSSQAVSYFGIASYGGCAKIGGAHFLGWDSALLELSPEFSVISESEWSFRFEGEGNCPSDAPPALAYALAGALSDPSRGATELVIRWPYLNSTDGTGTYYDAMSTAFDADSWAQPGRLWVMEDAVNQTAGYTFTPTLPPCSTEDTYEHFSFGIGGCPGSQGSSTTPPLDCVFTSKGDADPGVVSYRYDKDQEATGCLSPVAEVDVPVNSANLEAVNFGSSISGAGDINGDGYDDLLIGSTGAAYLYLATRVTNDDGSTTYGYSATPYATITGDTDDNSAPFEVFGDSDLNGDGFSDFAILVNETLYLFAGGPPPKP